nr:hypothetical protein [Propionibacterium sp.]
MTASRCARRLGVLVPIPLVFATIAGPAAPALAAPTMRSYYQATVNLLDAEAAGGFTGSVSFVSEVGGPASVSVYLSQASTVECGDGSEDFASVTVRTDPPEATSPGPITLDIDRRVSVAAGAAVVDLVRESSPGCGGEVETVVLPAQNVAIAVEGTTVRFRTGVDARVSSRRDAAAWRSVDFARDGVGTVVVGSLVDAATDTAWLKYAVDRTSARGDSVDLPPNMAPEGGRGAIGAFSRIDGEVFEETSVSATIGPAPARDPFLTAFSVRSALVECADGTVGQVDEIVDGAGPGQVAIDARLARAVAAGTLPATRYFYDSCTGDQGEEGTTLPVTLALEASGVAVRSVDTRVQVTPGEGVWRDRVAYVARPAVGTVSAGDVTGVADLAAISRAGR